MKKGTINVAAIGLALTITAMVFCAGPSRNKGYNKYLQETLPNGLDLIIKYNPDSRVYAINILGKNRSLLEPEGKTGIWIGPFP